MSTLEVQRYLARSSDYGNCIRNSWCPWPSYQTRKIAPILLKFGIWVSFGIHHRWVKGHNATHFFLFWNTLWFHFKSVAGKTFPAFPAHAQPAILRIWQEAHVNFDKRDHDFVQKTVMVKCGSTHWPLGDVAVISKMQFSHSCYRLSARVIPRKMHSRENHIIPLMISKHWFG